MSKPVWNDPFPPTPEGFKRTLINTLTNAEDRDMKRRHKFTATLAVALVAVLALAAAGYAATQSGLIEWMFEGIGDVTIPTKLLEQAIQKPAMTIEQDGVRFSIDEYLYDDNALLISLSAESTLEQPVFFGTNHPVIEPDLQLTGEGAPVGMEEFVALGGVIEGMAIEGRASTQLHYLIPKEALGKPLEFSVTASFFTTDREVKLYVPPKQEPKSDGAVYMVYSVHDGYTSRFIEPYAYPNVVQYTDKDDNIIGDEAVARDGRSYAESFIEMGYLKPLTEITLNLTIDPAAGNVRRTRIDGQSVFDFDEYTITIEKMNFSSSATDYKYTVTTKPGSKRSLKDSTLDFLLLDQDGKYQGVLRHMGGGGGGDEFEDGTETQTIEMYGPPVEQVPSQVILMPYNGKAWTDSFGGTWTDEHDDPRNDQQLSPFYYVDEAMTIKLAVDP